MSEAPPRQIVTSPRGNIPAVEALAPAPRFWYPPQPLSWQLWRTSADNRDSPLIRMGARLGRCPRGRLEAQERSLFHNQL